MTERCDVLYLSWNRRAYVEVTFPLLLKNTDWSRVDRLLVYEDGSTDGTREYLDSVIRGEDMPVETHLSYLGFRSPVKTMMHYLRKRDARPRFAKIDSDIAVPPGWLGTLMRVMDEHEGLELLGMQPGMGGPDSDEPGYGYTPCKHIGGVGLMRTSAFTTREQMTPGGRFGFTSWQERNAVAAGWVTPDIVCPQMDMLPFDPWPKIAENYRRHRWQREWPPYDMESTYLWDWIGL